MLKKKLVVVITNRSSYNKAKTILRSLPHHIEPTLILGNSIYLYKYGYAYHNIISDFPNIKILKTSLAVEGDDNFKMPKTVGLGLIELSTLIDNEKPDAVLSVADRYETMATAIAAAYVNVPLIHLQGGEISGTIDDKVRNAITQLADYHFPATNEAADRLMQMKPQDHARIWAYGCPSMDLLSADIDPYECDNEINQHGHGDCFLSQDRFIIVMLHPDTKGSEVDAGLVMDVLDEFPHQKLIFWSNIDPGGDKISKVWRMGLWSTPVRYVRHLEPGLFGHLLRNAECIIGNSSAGIREATYTGTPSITIGDRQKDRECGSNVLRVPFNKIAIENALIKQLSSSYVSSTMYGVGGSGELIAKEIGEILHE